MEHVTCKPVAALPKRGSIFSRRNVHMGLVVADHNNTTVHNMPLQSVDPLWNTQSHSINTRGKRKTLQENVKTSDFSFFFSQLQNWITRNRKEEQLRRVSTL